VRAVAYPRTMGRLAVRPPVAAVKRAVRRRLRTPFRPDAGRPLIVHCSHHKAGTVWFGTVLRSVAATYGLRFQRGRGEPVDATADVAFFGNARFFRRDDLGGRPFRGSHVIRDPRDVVVSGYHYHRWTKEEWVHRPDPRWGGLSYQAYLAARDEHDGLLAEIERSARSDLAEMAGWDYDQPEFLELRYEDVLEDEAGAFAALFRFYGFDEPAVRAGLEAVDEARLDRAAALARPEPTHVRSGQPGEWRALFGPAHVARFKELTGDLVVRLGYEADDTW
jgi:Sulfotransferase domain